MTTSLLFALITFAAITAWTPGPNNTILMASGINYGFRRTIPMIAGVCLGFPFMIGVIGLGLGKVFETYPLIYTTMKYAGAVYMLWLAWKIATSTPSDDRAEAGKPLTFLQGAAFQWINPKAWIMAGTALSAYTLPQNYHLGVLAVVLTFVVVGFTSSSGWALFGASLRHVMSNPKWFRIINYGLALSLIVSLAPILWH